MKATIALALLLSLPAKDASSPDGEGFIRNWLVLAPIPIEEGSGASEIDKEIVKDEGKLKPKEGDKTKVDAKELAWKAHQTKDFYIDFLESFGKERGEDACAYA